MSVSRGTADASVGMMEGAYFTSRKEILDFFNDLLALNLTKIEQTASGAVACQVIEYIFPGSVPLRRVNWEAKSEYEYIQNYKLLQAAFDKHRVQRHIDVDRLIMAKYQDNLEFCQWLKAFFDQAAPPHREDYDPLAARSKGRGGRDATTRFKNNARQYGSKLLPTDRHNQQPPAASTASPRKKKATPYTTATSGARGRDRSPPAKRNIASGASRQRRRDRPQTTTKTKTTPSMSSTSSADSVVADATLLKTNADLRDKNSQLELMVAELERERDFYFEKLRDVEVLLQFHGAATEAQPETNAPSSSDVIRKIFALLYATSEQKVSVDRDTGELKGDVVYDTDPAQDDRSAAPTEEDNTEELVATTNSMTMNTKEDNNEDHIVHQFSEDEDEDLLLDEYNSSPVKG